MIVAPMAGGPSTPSLVAAVSNGGGLMGNPKAGAVLLLHCGHKMNHLAQFLPQLFD